MTVTPGRTADQIRELVREYDAMPYGQMTAWLADKGVSSSQMRRWRDAVYAGDVEAGLVPRDPTSVRARRSAARREEAHRGEITRLEARVRQLEEVNDALGKAIGLLHKVSEKEPELSTTNAPESSSMLKTTL